MATSRILSSPSLRSFSPSSAYSSHIKSTLPTPIEEKQLVRDRTPFRFRIPALQIFPTSVNVLIRRLPSHTSEEALRFMMVWSKELINVELLPPQVWSEMGGYRCGLLTFKTMAGAEEARTMLHGRSNATNTADMIVEILGSEPLDECLATQPGDTNPSAGPSTIPPAVGLRQPSHFDRTTEPRDTNSSAGPSTIPPAVGLRQPSHFDRTPEPRDTSPTAGPSTIPPAVGLRQPPRFDRMFQPQERTSTQSNGIMPRQNLGRSDSDVDDLFGNPFSRSESPLWSHVPDRPLASGKSLINDGFAADDHDTNDLLKETLVIQGGSVDVLKELMLSPEIGGGTSRRATAPQLPVDMRKNLTLNTGNVPMSASVPSSYGNDITSPSSAFSPTGNHQMSKPYYGRHNFPPVNPADQNPPCNTLYVGNLPIDSSEEELKAMFSKQRGFKRLVLRDKGNGPMCFVEFEDISLATRALNELYGLPLHNSVKGGVRLSFSKNPLGVRTPKFSHAHPASHNNMNGMINGGSNAFATANGPPPGLAFPPGLGRGQPNYNIPSTPNHNRTGFGSANMNPWNGSPYTGGHMGAGTSGAPTRNHTRYRLHPPHMMGRQGDPL